MTTPFSFPLGLPSYPGRLSSLFLRTSSWAQRVLLDRSSRMRHHPLRGKIQGKVSPPSVFIHLVGLSFEIINTSPSPFFPFAPFPFFIVAILGGVLDIPTPPLLFPFRWYLQSRVRVIGAAFTRPLSPSFCLCWESGSSVPPTESCGRPFRLLPLQ